MSKIKQSPLGGVSGALGNLVGSSWKGIPYLRTKPAVYHDAKTPTQTKYRTRFGGCSKLSKSLKYSIIRPVWDCKAIQMSGHNLFISKNIAAFDKSGNIDSYDRLTISVGNMPPPKDSLAQVNPETPGQIQLCWSDNSNTCDASPNDRLNLVTIVNGEASYYTDLTATRGVQSATITIPAAKDNTVHLYIFFANEKNNLFSESIYHKVQC